MSKEERKEYFGNILYSEGNVNLEEMEVSLEFDGLTKKKKQYIKKEISLSYFFFFVAYATETLAYLY